MSVLRMLRAPLLHFVVGGAVVFRLAYGPAPFSAVARQDTTAPIVLTADDVARLRAQYTRDTGLAASDDDEAVLVAKAVEEELLFREAVARGLDQNDRSVRNWLIEQMAVLADGHPADPDALYARARDLGLDRTDLVVRRILVQKMRLLAARTDEQTPNDDVLRAFYADHCEEYAPPARTSFWQVFLASATHGSALPRRAELLLTSLRQTQRVPADTAREGDPFSVPRHLVSQSSAQITKLFGPEFAARIADAPAHTWVGPLPSAYGAHVVWIDTREPGAPPPFESVRQRVLERWQNERRAQRVVALLRTLATRYPLQIESAAWRSRSVS